MFKKFISIVLTVIVTLIGVNFIQGGSLLSSLETFSETHSESYLENHIKKLTEKFLSDVKSGKPIDEEIGLYGIHFNTIPISNYQFKELKLMTSSKTRDGEVIKDYMVTYRVDFQQSNSYEVIFSVNNMFTKIAIG